MQFKKFSSIENSYRDQFIEMIKANHLDGGEWVVTEKVHGGQLSIYYDGSELKASSRTMFLEGDADFYNYQKVLAENEEKIKKLFQLLSEQRENLSQIVIYGELFGGSYPHPDVPKVKTAKRLQKGVFYHPDNLFYAFDIRAGETYLTIDEADALFEAAGLFYAKPIKRGTFEECLKHPNTFPSQISGWLGLPPIDDNLAEGFVLRPVEPRFLPIGERIILKSKNEKFKERVKQKNRPYREPEKLSEQAVKLSRELLSMVTENRLQNVLSKRGELPYPLPKNLFGEIMKEFVADIMEEFNKDFREAYQQLEKKEQKKCSKQMTDAAAKVVRKELFSGG